ncbi:MAG: hypothetical protein HN402_00310 [Candidatus Scalindua sp.]|jgi:hypothetical protein|nr:hypothetical protein [Candidatus Scalindua sp.]MBT7558026.1 hypothetical protein [Candidatus Woesearchaeota archaeon]
MKLPNTVYVVNMIDGTGQQITTVTLFYGKESAEQRAKEMNDDVKDYDSCDIEDMPDDLPQGYIVEEMEIS